MNEQTVVADRLARMQEQKAAKTRKGPNWTFIGVAAAMVLFIFGMAFFSGGPKPVHQQTALIPDVPDQLTREEQTPSTLFADETVELEDKTADELASLRAEIERLRTEADARMKTAEERHEAQLEQYQSHIVNLEQALKDRNSAVPTRPVEFSDDKWQRARAMNQQDTQADALRRAAPSMVFDEPTEEETLQGRAGDATTKEPVDEFRDTLYRFDESTR